jgi:hypothetical protein
MGPKVIIAVPLLCLCAVLPTTFCVCLCLSVPVCVCAVQSWDDEDISDVLDNLAETLREQVGVSSRHWSSEKVMPSWQDCPPSDKPNVQSHGFGQRRDTMTQLASL